MDQFERICQIGQGSYGKVCIVKDKETDLIYVRKLLNKTNKNEEIKDLREAQTLKHLIQNIHHYGLPIFKCYTENNDSISIVYEYINGIKFTDYLRKEIDQQQDKQFTILPICDIQQYIKQLLYIVRFCHQQGICHNDIKPDQIIIDEATKKLTLIDFGEAYDIQQEGDPNLQCYEQSDIVAGNILFIPPELIQDDYNSRMSYQNLTTLKKYSVDDYLQQTENKFEKQIQPNTSQSSLKDHLGYLSLNNSNVSCKSSSACCPSPDRVQQKITYIGNYKFPRHHHLSSLFISHTSEDKLTIWTYALSRLYHYSIINQKYQYQNQNIELPLAQETIEKDLQRYAIQFNMNQLTPQMLYKLNIEMAHDCYSLGMTILCIIFNISLQRKTLIETKHALNNILEKINEQLNDTLSKILEEHQEFILFYQERNQKLKKHQKFEYKLAPGIMPQNMDLDLFLLIAGLVHNHPKVRLSIQESLCCPFILQKCSKQIKVSDWDIKKSILFISKMFSEQDYDQFQPEGFIETQQYEENQVFSELENTDSAESSF